MVYEESSLKLRTREFVEFVTFQLGKLLLYLFFFIFEVAVYITCLIVVEISKEIFMCVGNISKNILK